MPEPDDDRPLALLLLPRTFQGFILRDQMTHLLRAPGVVALEAGHMRYGAYARLPHLLADALAVRQARRLRRLALPGVPRVVVMFHPAQLPYARAIQAAHPGAELWYSRWDRYEHAYDAPPRLRERLVEMHATAAEVADLTFAVSGALADLEREAGRDALVVTSSADAFPAPEPERAVVAVCLGHLGHRIDWALLRALSERMVDLVLLLVGQTHPEELTDDEDFAALRTHDNVLFLGEQTDAAAARLIVCADVGIAPFKVEPFNDVGLPNRILKAARLGRRTITPMLHGVLTWEHAIERVDGPDAWIRVLREYRGARTRPDLDLRAWALDQRADVVNAPLRERLAALGVDVGRTRAAPPLVPPAPARRPRPEAPT